MGRPNDKTDCSLILSSPVSTGGDACINSLTVSEPTDTVALLVTYTNHDRPTNWLQAWEQNTGERLAQLNVIRVGDFTRSASPATTDGAPTVNGGIPIETVSDPHNLAELGIAISECLGRWEAESKNSSPNNFVVCFDSLTELLQYVDVQEAFRFLHVLTGRLQSAGAVAHFHLDPEAHDNQTISTLRTLFDAVIEDTDSPA
ncbi:DUF835 domain-containing protein [Halobacterium sp. KA-4]|uniref:DUF835 domain-containing protein n=1 Tax=Halobacterium sp. KA-4 TaxID=2896367 RepID=UPI001E3C6A0C|nr:DUF835 domain-containing protein [Halobacterium sp. KA-4]MCD2201352.1 DUF835 domain-containing protein [Halobacterium sp. KA-4]